MWRPVLPPLIVLSGLVLYGTGIIGQLTLDVVFALVVAFVLRTTLIRLGASEHRATTSAIAVAAVSIGLVCFLPGVALTPYLAVVLINGLVAAVFARGLLPGRTSVIAQMIRLTGLGPAGSTAFQRYAQRQCWVWTGLASVTMALGVGAVFLPGWRDGLGTAIFAMLAFQAAWFVGTHSYAQSRYGRPESCLDTLRAMANPNAWSKLEL